MDEKTMKELGLIKSAEELAEIAKPNFDSDVEKPTLISFVRNVMTAYHNYAGTTDYPITQAMIDEQIRKPGSLNIANWDKLTLKQQTGYRLFKQIVNLLSPLIKNDS